MAQQGSSLQNYNNELVKCIEDLKEKREEVRLAATTQHPNFYKPLYISISICARCSVRNKRNPPSP